MDPGTAEAHRRLVEDERAGRVLVGVETVQARKFFTESNHAVVQETIGESLYLERWIVKGSGLLGSLCTLLSLGLAVWAFGWWAALVVPVMLAVWMANMAESPRGGAGIKFGIFVLMVAGVAWLAPSVPVAVKFWLSAFALGLFFARFLYVSSTTFLRLLVLRNPLAFEALYGSAIRLREVK